MNKRIKNKITKRNNLKEHKNILNQIKKNGFTPYKEVYLDEYFLYSFGKSSVCHFQLKEIPEFLFAIWLIDGKMTNIFCEPIEFIDKFKPTAVSYNYHNLEKFMNFLFDLKENYEYYYANCWSCVDKNDIQRIHEIMTEIKEKRTKEYQDNLEDYRHTFQYWRKELFNEFPMIKKVCIYDCGANVTPRYDLFLEVDDEFYNQTIKDKKYIRHFFSILEDSKTKMEKGRPKSCWISNYGFEFLEFSNHYKNIKKFTYVYRKGEY